MTLGNMRANGAVARCVMLAVDDHRHRDRRGDGCEGNEARMPDAA